MENTVFLMKNTVSLMGNSNSLMGNSLFPMDCVTSDNRTVE
jgi:hypothetical protein